MANNINSEKKATPKRSMLFSVIFVVLCLVPLTFIAYYTILKTNHGIPPCVEVIVSVVVIILLMLVYETRQNLGVVIASYAGILLFLLLPVLVPAPVDQADSVWVVRDQEGQLKNTSSEQTRINVPKSFKVTVFRLPRKIFVGVKRLRTYGYTNEETYRAKLTLAYSRKDIEHLLDLPEYRFNPKKLHRELEQKVHDQVYNALKNHTQSEAITLKVITDAIRKLNAELGTTGIRLEGIELKSSYTKNPPAVLSPTPSPAPV
jgi:hypothetical protein